MATAAPITATPEQLASVRYNAEGLVPAIVQESGTGQVLMMAWMDERSLQETLSSARTVFWSRSRQERWPKGDSSGGRQRVRAAYYDCDGDTLLFVVDQDGPGACHTGQHSCFYRAFGPGQAGPGQAGPGQAGPGQAGPGQAGPGQAGPGQAGPGQAGPGQAGPGQAGPASAPAREAQGQGA